ncbi:Domain of uncharacterised function (DUF2825) [Salmonella enterica subsp. enterica]|nr:Domain of uncharacterised function (DUF2825) [Salmonella enterica subsp. enterica]
MFICSPGLSPLARGTPRVVPVVPGSVRFIPAGAGNTQYQLEPSQWTPVYPRWRGEHFIDMGHIFNFIGLSPLARGTHERTRSTQCFWRFIPAGAGNTRSKTQANREKAVYPRWRGEHVNGFWRDADWLGLSPLARGTLPVPLRLTIHRRFIPAGAGNTEPWQKFSLGVPVYPRWRGEHCFSEYKLNFSPGLSPLARGTPKNLPVLPVGFRFIPAGAGNTPCAVFSLIGLPVYPRWRGEHF